MYILSHYKHIEHWVSSDPIFRNDHDIFILKHYIWVHFLFIFVILAILVDMDVISCSIPYTNLTKKTYWLILWRRSSTLNFCIHSFSFYCQLFAVCWRLCCRVWVCICLLAVCLIYSKKYEKFDSKFIVVYSFQYIWRLGYFGL